MIIKLIKKNKKHTDFIVLEKDGCLIRIKEGKLGMPAYSSFTGNYGNNDNAILEIKKMTEAYLSKGYVIEDESPIIEFEVFDKAKWHFDGDFPKELNIYQAYVHTGFFIGWLVIKDLISEEFKVESRDAIQRFLNKEITCVQLFDEQLDGVFSSNEVNDKGYSFTKSYFEFENGNYLNDYEMALASDFPSLYYVQDTWDNFEKICSIIEKGYQEFISTPR